MVSLLERMERWIGWRNLIPMILMRIMALENFSSVWMLGHGPKELWESSQLSEVALYRQTCSGIESDFDISSSYLIWFGGTDTKTVSARAFGLLRGIGVAAYLLGWRRSRKIVSRVRFGKITYSNTYSHHFRYWQIAIWKYASRNHSKTPPYQEFSFRISAIGL